MQKQLDISSHLEEEAQLEPICVRNWNVSQEIAHLERKKKFFFSGEFAQ